MKFKSSLICLLLCSSISMHALKFEKLQPLMKICSVVPWQHLFNVGVLGALGWFGYDNFQLRKNSLTKEDANNTFQPIAAMKDYVTEEKAQETYGPLNVGQYMLKTEAAAIYLPQSATKSFVQKNQEENDNLAQTVVALTLPAFNKQFVNINTFNALKGTCVTKEELAAIQKQVDKCVTLEKFSATLEQYITKADLTDLQKQTLSINTKFDTFQQEFTQYKEEQKNTSSNLALTLKQGLESINTVFKGLSSNEEFIKKLAPNVAGFLTQEEFHDTEESNTN